MPRTLRLLPAIIVPLLLASLLLALGGAPTRAKAAPAFVGFVVNSEADSNIPDSVLTLREALSSRTAAPAPAD